MIAMFNNQLLKKEPSSLVSQRGPARPIAGTSPAHRRDQPRHYKSGSPTGAGGRTRQANELLQEVSNTPQITV